jgi:hypothetical protein
LWITERGDARSFVFVVLLPQNPKKPVDRIGIGCIISYSGNRGGAPYIKWSGFGGPVALSILHSPSPYCSFGCPRSTLYTIIITSSAHLSIPKLPKKPVDFLEQDAIIIISAEENENAGHGGTVG